MNTYIIEGGVGKHIAFTSLIPALAARDNGPIQVFTPYVDVFAGNPLVKLALESTTLPLDDPRILVSDDIIYCEPYKSTWQRGTEHLITAYARLLGVQYQNEQPQLFTSHRQKEADEILAKITRPFIITQFSGGQSPTLFQPGNQYQSTNPGRNYPAYLAQQVITKLKDRHPELTILNWSLPNEQQYEAAEPLDAPYAVVHELLKHAAGTIGVDSCLMHLARAANTTGVFLWGNTRINQFGYEQNTNLTFHGSNTYELNDPRNIMVDPDTVVTAFLKQHYTARPLSPLRAKLGNKKVKFKR